MGAWVNMNNLTIELNNASISEVRKVFMEYFQEEEVDKVINFLSNQKEFFDDESEFFKVNSIPQKKQPGKLGLFIPNTNYFINIKLASIAIIARIFDYKLKLPIGASALILSGSGKSGQFIAVVSENDGSKCLVREAANSDKRTLCSESILCNTKNECVNNDLSCKYKQAGICNINKEDIVEIIDKLVKKNVFEKVSSGYKLAL